MTAVAVAAVSLWPRRPSWTVHAVVGLSAAALVVGSVWASATVVAAQLGPFDSPYQPASISAHDRAVNAESAAIDAGLVRAAARVDPSVSVITLETSSGSSVPILATGHEFLPVGGFTGRVPTPTLAQFIDDVWRGKVAVVLAAVSPRTRNPDLLWAMGHCRRQPYRGPDSHIAGTNDGFLHLLAGGRLALSLAPARAPFGAMGCLGEFRRRGSVGWRWQSRWSRSPCPR